MSLLVWLPMTKDLTQQGLSDITVSNVGATLDNNGKLGKCYYFDGNAHYLEFSKSVGDLYSSDFSYAVWLKPTDDTRSIICSEYASSGASGISFELSASRGIRLYWDGSPDIYPTNCTLPKNEWSHVAITRSGNEAKFYVNGELRYTYTGTLSNKASTAKIRLGDDYRGGTSVSYMGYMNDFRLYDHALAHKEIEILSRGLVAHYSLSPGGQENLLKNTNQGAAGWGWSSSGGSRTVTATDDGGVKLTSVTAGTSWSVLWYQDNNVKNIIEASQKYVLSFDCLPSASATLNVDIKDGNATNAMTNKVSAAIIANQWNHVVCKLTAVSSITVSNQVIYIASYPLTDGTWIEIKNLKLEKGEVATPWTPNSTDTTYTTMGYDSTTEYDLSGYQNDLTKTGTVTYLSDTAKYSASSHFINGSYLIGNQNVGEILPKDAITVNLWVKPTTWSNPISCTEGGGFNFEGSTIQFPLYVSGVGYKVASSGVTGASLQDDKWHMLTGTFSSIDQQVKIYIDGELKATTATGSSNGIGYASNRLVISGEASGGAAVASSQFVGEESDVRIYATALTADQIKELYNSSANIAKNGTMIAYEFIEN